MRTDWRMFAAVAVGGAVGSVARFALGTFIQTRVPGPFPLGTLVINVAGSLLLGFLAQFGLDTTSLSPEVKLLLTTGFCGGFTTFSTFSYETVKLIENGEYADAGAYVGLSVGLSIVGTMLGIRGARKLVVALRAGGGHTAKEEA